ncbi:MAG: hypothetical protein Q8K98_00755 [Bacteroidota bacterium]|nr:hypothetical protein [Bacteroidota bacterium]
MFYWNIPLRWSGNTLFPYTATDIQVLRTCPRAGSSSVQKENISRNIYLFCAQIETISEKWMLHCGKQEATKVSILGSIHGSRDLKHLWETDD